MSEKNMQNVVDLLTQKNLTLDLREEKLMNKMLTNFKL